MYTNSRRKYTENDKMTFLFTEISIDICPIEVHCKYNNNNNTNKYNANEQYTICNNLLEVWNLTM